MPDSESAMYVPLRSNAKTLVTGTQIAALRRRLKFASVIHDRLFLESGVLRLQAGEGGSSSFVEPATADRPAGGRPRQRQLAQQSSFQIAAGRESAPGVSAEKMHPVLSSDSAISWTTTLEPFAAELPAGTDWIDFGKFARPGPGVDRIARDWTGADERNPYLDQVIPGRFVRAAVTKNARHDLTLAAAAGHSVTMDGLHSQVVVQRFGDEAGWKFQGYAIPFLFPQVGDWTWEQIAELRRDRSMARFRTVLREIEDEAAAESRRRRSGGGRASRLRAEQRRSRPGAHRICTYVPGAEHRYRRPAGQPRIPASPPASRASRPGQRDWSR